MKKFGILILFITILLSCNKEEGPGGFSTISGTLVVQEVNKYNQVINSYPAIAKDIYITYGDGDYFDDDLETSNDGYFKFTNLTAGGYTIWYYTDDTTSYTGDNRTFISQKVIVEKKEDKSLGTLYTVNIRDIDDGTSSISGTVFKIKYWTSSIPPYDSNDIKDITPAQDYDVYIVYENDITYFDRTRTNYNGVFEFSNLIKGNYRVFVYSDDVLGGIYNDESENVIYYENSLGSYDLVIYRDVAITSEFEKQVVSDMYIER